MPELQEAIPITVEKCKVGPITERYSRGEYRTVDRDNAYAVCGLDNSHNKDYKVAYTSDPLLVISCSEMDMNHTELRKTLKSNGLWKDEFHPVHIPCGDEWKPGFKSLPRSSNQFDLFKSTMKKKVQRDIDYLEGKNGATAYIPV